VIQEINNNRSKYSAQASVRENGPPAAHSGDTASQILNGIKIT